LLSYTVKGTTGFIVQEDFLYIACVNFTEKIVYIITAILANVCCSTITIGMRQWHPVGGWGCAVTVVLLVMQSCVLVLARETVKILKY